MSNEDSSKYALLLISGFPYSQSNSCSEAGVSCMSPHSLWLSECALRHTYTLPQSTRGTAADHHAFQDGCILEQARNQLGTPGGVKSFLGRAQIF